MREMYGIVGRADLWALVGVQELRHKAQDALFGFDGGATAGSACRAKGDAVAVVEVT